jgi:hypothetical protein
MYLRHLLLSALLPFWALASHAQTPEPIYGKNKRLMPMAYYQQQMGLWKAVVDKEPANADAWLNYYTASRNAYIAGQEGENALSRGPQRFARLDTIVQAMEQHVPGTFEYDLVKWSNGNNDPDLLPYLEKAHVLEPERPEPYMDLIVAYEYLGKDALRDTLCKAYLQLRDFSPGLLNYGYNLLMGLQPNAVLFTHGDKDSEAIWLLQGGMGFRHDVQLLNVDLLLRKDYRERVFAGMKVPQLAYDPLSGDADLDRYRKQVIADVSAVLPDRPVYVSLSAEGPYTRPIVDSLYLTGLAYRYSTAPFDPMPELLDNYLSRYALYSLTHPADADDISIGNVHQFDANYLPSLFLLCDHYIASGDTAAARKYGDIAKQVAADAGRSKEFAAHFGK